MTGVVFAAVADGNNTGTTYAVMSLAFSVFVGGVAMAWRLGRLEQKVNDAREDIKELKEQEQARARIR